MTSGVLNKVVFLDRDGVINKDSSDYINSVNEFNFLKRSLDGIKLLTENDFNIILITNQSVINRKMVSVKGLDEIFSYMKLEIQSHNGKIKDIFYCPHIPSDNCDCRKPKPGLILKAKKEYNIDLSKSYMIGDSVKDIECAKNAGCAHSVLVKTGNGLKSIDILLEKKISPDYVSIDLYDAAKWVINHNR